MSISINIPLLEFESIYYYKDYSEFNQEWFLI